MKARRDSRFQLRINIMRFSTLQLLIGLCAATVVGACAATENKSADAVQSQPGWYMEHGGQGKLQLCGQSQQLLVTSGADLHDRALAFGLEEDTPVYVRVLGSVKGEEISVSRVEQFGSPTPVRNCGMTGVVIPAPDQAER
jgi:hypothetical protein